MGVLLLAVPVVIFAFFLVVFMSKKQGGKTTQSNLTAKSDVLTFKKRLLLTESEAVFYRQLLPVVPEGFALMAKVGLWAIIKNDQRAGWSKISQKQCDFVIFKDEFLPVPVAVIELDDKSHNRANAQKRDDVKDSILKSAGIPVYRFPVQKEYVFSLLREELFNSSSETF